MKRPSKIEQAVIDYLVSDEPAQRHRLRSLIEAAYPGALDRAKERTQKARTEARFAGKPPAWAKRFVLKHGSSNVTLTWRRSRATWKDYASGHCYGSRLVVTAPKGGDDATATKTTVLHEIAHSIAWHDLHGPNFYDEFVRLLKAEGLYRFALAEDRRSASSLRAASRRARKAAAR